MRVLAIASAGAISAVAAGLGCGTKDTATPAAPAAATPAPSPPPRESVPTPSAWVAAPAGGAVAAAPTILELPDPKTVADSHTGRDNGDWAPELALIDLRTGKPWKLSNHVGPRATESTQAAIVSFSASWCGPCRLSLPFLKQLEDQNPGTLEVVIVSMDEDDAGRKKEVEAVAAAGLDAPVLEATPEVLTAWLGRRRNIPHLYILNRAGEVLVQDRGFGDKVRKVLPGQVRYALTHPEYVVRRKAE